MLLSYSACRTTKNFIHSRSNSSVIHNSKLHWPDLTSTDLAAGVTCSLTHQVNTRKLEDLGTRQCHSQETSSEGFSTRRTACNSSKVYVGFVVDKVPVRQGFLQNFAFPNQLSFQQCPTIILLLSGPRIWQQHRSQFHSVTAVHPPTLALSFSDIPNTEIGHWGM